MFQWAKLRKNVDISKYFSFFYQKLLLFQIFVVPLHPLWLRNLLRCHAQMAESVDALVSNTSGATRAGSTPALGTSKGVSTKSKVLQVDLQHFFFLAFLLGWWD